MLKLVRLYGHHSPLPRGKRFLYTNALRLRALPKSEQLVESRDGRRFHVDLTDPIYRDLFFIGDYEPEVSRVARSVLRPGDIAVDAGANFGWFTILFADLVGPSGGVHSFEPVPWIYDQLTANLQLNGEPTQVHPNQLALGERSGNAVLHVFAGLNQGHASMSDLGRDDYTTHTARVVSLDGYCSERSVSVPEIALLKCDVEGAELAVLRGASAILSSDHPPVVIVEINDLTAQAFGYRPSEILSLLQEYGYEFLRITKSRAHHLGSVGECRHGDNILCVVPGVHDDRINRRLWPR